MIHYQIALKCSSGKNKGEQWKFKISKETIVIGRLQGCHLLLNDAKVSQSHCLIQIQNDLLCILDMGSTHGTFINSKKLVGIQYLQNQDIILVGETKLQLNILHPKNIPNKEKRQKQIEVTTLDLDGKKNESENATMHDALATNYPKELYQKTEKELDETNIDTNILENHKIKTIEPQPSTCSNIAQSRSSDSTPATSPIVINKLAECLLCNKKTELNYCQKCLEYGSFIQDKLTDYKLIQKLLADETGLLIVVKNIKESKHYFMYLYKQFLPSEILAKNILSPKVFCTNKEKSYSLFPFICGNFLTLDYFFNLHSSQKVHLAIQIAKHLHYCYRNWGTLAEIGINNIYIKANGNPIIYGYGLPYQKESIQKNITSFGKLLFLLFTQVNYQQKQNTPISQYFTNPVWAGFFAKIVSNEKTQYHSWNDVVDALHLMVE